MAAVEVLDNRASAPDGGVRAGCHQPHFLRFGFAVAAQRCGGFCSNETGKVLEMTEKLVGKRRVTFPVFS